MDGKARILGVDDSLTIRKALEIVLKPAGYELELAADGAEAIDKAKSFRPALILLDFILPDMRGTEVCRRLADDPDTANIPIVLVSAKNAEIRQAYQDVGNVVSYIAKPFKPQVVISIVAEVLAKAATGELFKSMVTVHEGTPLLPVPQTPPAVISFAAQSPALDLPIPATGNGHDYPSEQVPRGNGREEVEDAESEDVPEVATASTRLSDAARHEMLEVMFETLRAGLEGVYVEEVDTPAGAAVDQATTHIDLIERLGRQLAESLHHARHGARYMLYGDGSVRSFDETLLDIFRRSCRLLFRTVVAGVVENEAATNRQRILVACHRASPVYDQVQSMLSAHPDWQVFTITEGFRQLPLMIRLFGPTQLIAEVTWSGALWDQLRTLQGMPEARTMTVIGLTAPERMPNGDSAEARAALAERGIATVLTSAFEVEPNLAAPAVAAADPPTVASEFNEMQVAV